MPIFFIISTVNLTMMYWVDKYLLLRVNTTPLNMSEKPIQHACRMLYWVFYMHFFVGFCMITNDSIIHSDQEYSGYTIADAANLKNINFFDGDRYNSYHAVVFFVLGVILMVLAKLVIDSNYIYEMLNGYLENKFAIAKTTEGPDSISDDYYELMSIKYLVSEYNRALIYRNKLEKMDANLESSAWSQKLRIKQKIATIENQIKKACNIVA